jgi:hypothetical protein
LSLGWYGAAKHLIFNVPKLAEIIINCVLSFLSCGFAKHSQNKRTKDYPLKNRSKTTKILRMRQRMERRKKIGSPSKCGMETHQKEIGKEKLIYFNR